MLNGCKTGDAQLTRGYRLPARYVIHTVGPVWQGGGKGEAGLLASCYRRSLELARAHDCVTLAFPAISTGIYRYPKDEAAAIAIRWMVWLVEPPVACRPTTPLTMTRSSIMRPTGV